MIRYGDQGEGDEISDGDEINDGDYKDGGDNEDDVKNGDGGGDDDDVLNFCSISVLSSFSGDTNDAVNTPA